MLQMFKIALIFMPLLCFLKLIKKSKEYIEDMKHYGEPFSTINI